MRKKENSDGWFWKFTDQAFILQLSKLSFPLTSGGSPGDPFFNTISEKQLSCLLLESFNSGFQIAEKRRFPNRQNGLN